MKHLILAASVLAVASCAGVPRDACTRDWFAWQADDIQRDFVRRNRGPVRRMRDLQGQLTGGFDDGVDPFAVLALASAKKDVRLLVDDFRERVVPEARAIAATCELDSGYDIIVGSFLAKNGVDADLVELLGLFGAFEGTPGITQALEPTRTGRADGVRGSAGF